MNIKMEKNENNSTRSKVLSEFRRKMIGRGVEPTAQSLLERALAQSFPTDGTKYKKTRPRTWSLIPPPFENIILCNAIAQFVPFCLIKRAQ